MTGREAGTSRAGGGPCPDAFAACLADMGEALDKAAGAGAWAVADRDLPGRVGQALAVVERAQELACRLVAECLDRGVPAESGAASPAGWLTGAYRVSGAAAARLLAGASLHASGESGVDGAGSTRLGPTRAAWAAGALSGEQAVLVGEAVAGLGGDLDPASADGLQDDLVGCAGELGYRQFRILCQRAAEIADPDGADARLAAQLEAEEQRALDETRLRFYRRHSGLMGFTGALPDLQYQMLKNALDAHTSPRHRPGDEPSPIELAALNDAGATGGRLSHEQRQGRAFAELIEHLPADRLARQGRADVTLVVTVALDTLRHGTGAATLPDGTPLSPAQARRLACSANVVPAVFGGDSEVLDLGRAARLFSPGQRTALELRDRGCVFPTCERPAPWCEAHHITPWAKGGPTDLSNAALLCGHHHRLVHSGQGWDIQPGPGHPHIIAPTRIDPTRTPQHHQRFDHPRRT